MLRLILEHAGKKLARQSSDNVFASATGDLKLNSRAGRTVVVITSLINKLDLLKKQIVRTVVFITSLINKLDLFKKQIVLTSIFPPIMFFLEVIHDQYSNPIKQEQTFKALRAVCTNEDQS